VNKLFGTRSVTIVDKYLFCWPIVSASSADSHLTVWVEIGRELDLFLKIPKLMTSKRWKRGKKWEHLIIWASVTSVQKKKAIHLSTLSTHTHTVPSWWLQKSHSGMRALIDAGSCWPSSACEEVDAVADGTRFCLVMTVDTAHLFRRREKEME
jgi:hypothetical protein